MNRFYVITNVEKDKDVYKRQNAWSVGMTLDRNPGLVLSEFGR